MAKLWQKIVGRDSSQTTERFSLPPGFVNGWDNMNFNLYRSSNTGSKTEEEGDDFVGLSQQAYKSNGVVFACCMARALVFSEVTFKYQQIKDGRPGDLFGTPDLKILENPWPNGTTAELLMRAIQDADLAGNHYVVTEGVGDEKRLRRLRPDWVSIILDAPPDKATHQNVAGYMYRPGGTDDKSQYVFYPIDGSNGAIAHWSPIPDPEAAYRGMSWLTPVIREIQGDKFATTHKLKFFENAATPNIAVSFKETVTAEQFKAFMQTMDDTKSGVQNAYETLYLGGGADVTVIGSEMRTISFKELQGLSETRIAAAARVHPAIVGLSEGLQGSALNEGNFQAAKEGFADGTLRPLWRSLATAYSALVPDQTDARNASRLWYDDRDIAFLKADRQKVAQIKTQDSLTISRLIMNGFDPDATVKYVRTGDLRLLEGDGHTGLVSVQLLPPGATDADGNGKADPVKKDEKKPPATEKKPPAKVEAKSVEAILAWQTALLEGEGE